jgi:hypothetical protein
VPIRHARIEGIDRSETVRTTVRNDDPRARLEQQPNDHLADHLAAARGGFVARFDVEKSSSNITLTTRRPTVADHHDEPKEERPIAVANGRRDMRSSGFVQRFGTTTTRRIRDVA